ncbi:butyrophilin-like protein 2 [Xyrichtys novacula]|uniref:Butyrophilin-like protein 2 n=1 Tax=Xyrichtys novacula TaxID=13765 RepID=A0AAV1HKQ4_XYRNO|nr:butyrophilin-like protein 2 [Xyrichtys novacula]
MLKDSHVPVFLCSSLSLSVSSTGTLVVNAAHRSCQAEVDQNLTLEWAFTLIPDSSLQTLNIVCSMFNNQKYSVLFHLHKGAEVPQKKRDFEGRVRCDKEDLREGRIRLDVSSLRTEDSGWYQCDVLTEHEKSWDRFYLSVTGELIYFSAEL